MAINTNPVWQFEQNLTPEQMAELLALRAENPYWQTQVGDANESQTTPAKWWTTEGQFAPTLTDTGNFYQPRNVSTWGGSDTAGVWGPDGKWQGWSSGATDLRNVANFIATSLAAYGAQGAMYGGEGGAVSGMDLAADNPSMWNVGNISAGGTGGTAGTLAETANYGNEASRAGQLAGVNSANATAPAGMASAGTGLASYAKDAYDALGGAKGTGALLGAAAGALSSKDQTQTSTRDPWSEAQPFLKQQLAQGSQLSNQYAAQPFSQAQQTAYGNVGGLLDMINSNAGGLMANAGAVGQNQFRRGMYQPTQFQGIGAPQGYGLLGNFGTKG